MSFFASLTFLICSFLVQDTTNTSAADAIVGKWQSMGGSVTVEVYREGEEFKAKLVSFDDSDDKNRPMHSRLDDKNPDRNLRNRKVLGTDIVTNLQFNSKQKRWENGVIYDTRTGKSWSAVAAINRSGHLQVKGYWKFEFISKTAKFKKVE